VYGAEPCPGELHTAAASALTHRPLAFVLDPVLQELARLHGFRARAVVDWIKIEIETSKPTNFHTVQDRLRMVLATPGKPWVEGLNEGPGRAATRFAIKLHDLTSYGELIGILDRLGRHVDLTGERKVLALEVAVDFYSGRNDRAELEALVLRLKHSICAEGEKELEEGLITERVENVRELRADRTLLIEAPDLTWRVYLKVTDNNKRPILDPNLHRARVEVTLENVETFPEWVTLNGLANFRFQGLTRFFTFRTLIPDPTIAVPPSPVMECIRKRRWDMVLGRGHRELPRPRKSERRKHHRATRADSQLKERVRDALRDLSRRFASRP
jgi:hypothetical protein